MSDLDNICKQYLKK